MSQISILGFASSSPSQDPSGPGPIHWSILVSPQEGSEATPQPQPKPKRSRFLQRWHSPTQPQQPVFQSTLFDMHNHQLRQQQFPVPVSASSDSASEAKGSKGETITDITSPFEGKPLRLIIRIALSTHHSDPQKLASRVSTLLYGTPTYGPEDDWLRAALEELIYARILDSETISYDVDGILNYTRGAVTNPSLGFDYPAHMTRTAQVKEMFSSGQPASKSPSVSPSRISRPANKRASSSKGHSFLGFWVTQGGSGQVRHHQEKRDYWRRQDDPYGGLM